MRKKYYILYICAVLIVVVFSGGQVAANPPLFLYEDLGNLGGVPGYYAAGLREAGINDSGVVVGYSLTPSGKKHAFVKVPGKAMQDLGALAPSGSESHALAINNGGLVGGYYVDAGGTHACFWTPSGQSYLFKGLGGTNSQVTALNLSGYAVGVASVPSMQHAQIRFPDGTVKDLGFLPGDFQSFAKSINNSNVIVGRSLSTAQVGRACIWTPSGVNFTIAPLFDTTNSYGNAINNGGTAVGSRGVTSYTARAVLKPPGGTIQDLGNLGVTESVADDINDSEWVVGYSNNSGGIAAFLWTPTSGMLDLNKRVVNLPAGLKLVYAPAINSKGEIVAFSLNGICKLTPITDISNIMLLLLDN
ncbi:MAG: hypothetical protein P4L55_07695 [Syntrophobacteraceae bacterium]|nr:hypothetical protein [Syntrophobacteraceae bacterium]